jgi:hypothetical protein
MNASTAFSGYAATSASSSGWWRFPVVRSGKLSTVVAEDAEKVDVNEVVG